MKKRSARTITTLFLSTLLAGCALHPKELTQTERKNQADQDREAIRAHTPKPTKPISLYEAMARGLMYNLDHRVKLFEMAYAQDLTDIADWDLLPQATLNAGYSHRSNVLASNSKSISDGRQSLETSTSTDNSRRTFDIGVLWNVLDFGTAYFQSRQKSDESKIAKIRKLKVLQNIANDIRSAYWRAVTAQLLMGKIEKLIDEGYYALSMARKLEKENVQPQFITLNYQKTILDALSKLFKQRREFAMAKAELASLMNLEPGTEFSVLVPLKKELHLPAIKLSVDMLENMGLLQRPELWEEDYNHRIAKDEIYKTYMSIFPGINLETRRNYDSNSYLFNQSWTDYSARLGLQLFRALSMPSRLKAARSKLDIIQTRRMSLSMAILTQIHISLERFGIAKNEYEFAKKIDRVSSRIAEISAEKGSSQLEDKLKVIEDKCAGLVAHIRRYASYAEVQAAYGRLLNSLGLEPFPNVESGVDLETLTGAIQKSLEPSEKILDSKTVALYQK